MDKEENQLLYKEVIKTPLSTILPNNKPPKGKTHAILEKDSGRILHFCSKEYNLRSNSSIFPVLENLISKKYSFEKQVRIVENTKFYVDYVLIYPIICQIGEILPRISVWNSYDGTIKSQLKFGYFSTISGNLLTRPIECRTPECDCIPVDENTISNILEIINKFIQESKNDILLFNKLATIKAGPELIDKIGKKIHLAPKTRTVSLERFEFKVRGGYSYQNSKGENVIHPGSSMSCCTAYQAINYGIYNTNPKELPDCKLKRDRGVLQELLKLL